MDKIAGLIVSFVRRFYCNYKSDMDKVPAYSCFLPVIRDCLKEIKDRPAAAQLCHSPGQLKNTPAYSGSHSAVLLEVGFIIPNTIVLVELFRYFQVNKKFFELKKCGI